MKNLLFVLLLSTTLITTAIAQLPFAGMVVYWQLMGDISGEPDFCEKNNSPEFSSPYRRINKGNCENPYARGNFSLHRPLNCENKNVVPEYLLTTAPRKDNILVGGMMLTTFAIAGIPQQEFTNPDQNTVMISCLVTTAITFAIVQVWNKRKKSFRRTMDHGY